MAGTLLAAAGLVVVAFGASCRKPAAAPGDVAPRASASGSAARPDEPGAVALDVALDDARLAEVAKLERAGDHAGAVAALRAAEKESPAGAKACAWDYLEGRLLAAQGAHAEAATAFERASADACPLRGYARLRAAQSAGRVGTADRALALLEGVPGDLAARGDVDILRAEALSQKGDRAAALPLWRASIARHAHGSRWVDTEMKIASALLDGVAGPPAAHAREALDRATRVMVEAPKLADAVGASQARARAIAMLPVRERPPAALDDMSRARQAQAWLDAGDAAQAFGLASAVLAERASAEARCKAAQTRAHAARKAKKPVPEAWADAVQACDKDPALVTVLYTAAKTVAGKDPRVAIGYFSTLESRFPTHRLADDARFRGALTLRELGEPDSDAKADEMLLSVPSTYPEGDMGPEALFRVALPRLARRDWRGAAELLDRIVALTPDDQHWATAGRAEYFRARASEELGDVADARARYAKVVERHPLAFYMLLAHARLARADAAAAAKLLKDAADKDKGAASPSGKHAVFDTPAFVLALRLLEVGEIDLARAELIRSGALADDADHDVVWTVASLFNRAGAPDVGISFSRSRLSDHLSHYPEGRWRGLWEIAYPRPFEPHVVKSSADYGVPATLVWAIMREESGFIAGVRSHANAIGLMQLIPPTAKWIAAGTGLPFDDASLAKPEVSVALGTKLLGKLRAKHGHPALAVCAYNGGSGAVDRWVAARGAEPLDMWVELVPFDETRGYVKRVLASQAAYAWLYDPGALAEPLSLAVAVTK